MRKFVLCLFLIGLILLGVSAASAQSEELWYRDGRVLDTTGRRGTDGTIVQDFNRASIASGYPVYLVIVGEEWLGVDVYPDIFVQDVADGLHGNAYRQSSGWLPNDVIVLAVAPYVSSSSNVYDYSGTVFLFGGVYDRLNSFVYPGHGDMASFEIATSVNAGIDNNNWQSAVVQAVADIAQAAMASGIGVPVQQVPVAPQAAVATVRPTVMADVAPTVRSQAETIPVPETQNSGSSTSILLIVMLVVVIGAGVAVFVLVYNQRQERRVAQQAARLQQTAASGRVNDLSERLASQKQIVEALAGQVAEGTARTLSERLTSLDQTVGRLSRGYKDISSSAGDPTTPGLSVAEYEAMATGYGEIVAEAEVMETEIASMEQSVQTVRDLMTTAPEKVVSVQTSYDVAVKAVAAVVNTGYFCKAAKALLVQAEQALEKAKQALTDRDYLEIAELAQTVTELTEQAIESAESEAQFHQELTQEVATQTTDVDALTAHITDGRATLERMKVSFAKHLWYQVVDNPDKADDAVRQVRGMLEQVAQLMDMQVQDWTGADEQLDVVHQAIQDAGWLINSIVNLEAELEKAKAAAAQEITDAEADLKKATLYLTQHDVDVPESLETALAEAGKSLELACRMLREAQPDYPEVVRVAREVNATADQILADARSATEQMARVQKAADTELREGQRAVTTADDYIDDHRSDVDSTAKRQLQTAEGYLAEAQQANEKAQRMGDGQEAEKLSMLSRVAERANKAESEANEALKTAKSDVSDAEEARRPTVSYSSTTFIVGSTPSNSHRRESSMPAFGGGHSKPSWSSSPSRPSRPSSSPMSVTRSSRSSSSASKPMSVTRTRR